MSKISRKDAEKAVAKANHHNKTAVFEALSKAGITQVRVAFDGEGDQRQMDRAVAKIKGDTVDFPDMDVTLYIANWGSVNLTTTGMTLQAAVEHVCYGYLEEKWSGWEIDEGSFGEFVFNVAKRKLTLDYYGRIVETDYSQHTL